MGLEAELFAHSAFVLFVDGLPIEHVVPDGLALQVIPAELLLRLFVHYVVSVFVDILFLLDLFRVVNHHIGLQVEFGGVHGHVVILAEGLVHVLFDLVVKVVGDGMHKDILPFDSLFGVDHKHPLQNVLDNNANVVDVFGEMQRLVLDVVDEVHHVARFVGGSMIIE